MAPILEGGALRKAWLAHHATGADPAAQEGPQSPAGVRVVVLDAFDATPASGLRRVAYEEAPEPSGRHEPCMLSGNLVHCMPSGIWYTSSMMHIWCLQVAGNEVISGL